MENKDMSNRNLGSFYPRSVKLWSNKNTTAPFDYNAESNEIVYWKCQNEIHDDYQREIRRSRIERFQCPNCKGKGYHPNFWNRLELTGQIFGELKVDAFSHTGKYGSYWSCTCSCGAKVIKLGSDLRSGKIKTCGNKSLHKRGENNSNWRGGLTEQNYSERYTEEYKKWHHDVLEKDNYTCQCCGQYGGNLQTHHIYDFATYENLRTELSNGITLCDAHHDTKVCGSFHNTMGTIGKTPEELEIYINEKRKQLGIQIPFSIDSYLNGNILKPQDILYTDDENWIFNNNSIDDLKNKIA